MTAPCGCCTLPVVPTPLTVDNRPALSAIVYRVGTYASFREAMLLAIADAPELGALTTWSDDDYAITIVDLWAAVADVLTFYQERYANESYLRTAQFRDSILRLAGLIGYRPRPGIAARTALAFTLDNGMRLTIAAGQKVQSVPVAGAQPQTFETLDSVTADWRFNRLRVYPLTAAVNPLAVGTSEALLDRVHGPALAAGLAPNANVVVFNDGTGDAVEEKKVATVRSEGDRTFVSWKTAVTQPAWGLSTRVFRFRRTLRLYGVNAPEQITAPFTPDPSAPSRIVWRLAALTSLGSGAGNTIQLDSRYEGISAGSRLLIADSGKGGVKTLVTVKAVRETTAALSYSAAGTTFDVPSTTAVTELTVAPLLAANLPAISNRRSVVVYDLQGDGLSFAGSNYPAALTGDTVYLPGRYAPDEQGPAVVVERTVVGGQFQPGILLRPPDLEKGRQVLITDDSGTVANATIKSAVTIVPANPKPGQLCHLAIPLLPDAPLSLDASSAVLLANVAPASHGESVTGELVGSGDSSAAFQRLSLRKKPLTWLPAANAGGAASTLQLFVDGIRWAQTAQLYGKSGSARVYELITSDDGSTTVQFGDGSMGAVLPTGANNVVANYRVGSGLAGRVGANSLTTLLAKPPGLSNVTNPEAADGGADAETLAQARENAPRTVRTFGRIVSLRDFEDQVTASGEVAKAVATFIWDGLDRAVYLTVAGQQGALFSDAGLRELADNLKAVRDTNHRLRLANYNRVSLQVRAGVAVKPEYVAGSVLAEARSRLLEWLSFDNLGLGQTVNLSDIYRVLQETPGALFVDIDLLQYKRPAGVSDAAYVAYLASRGAEFLPTGDPAPVQSRLRVFVARADSAHPGKVLPAELASVEEPAEDITLEVRA